MLGLIFSFNYICQTPAYKPNSVPVRTIIIYLALSSQTGSCSQPAPLSGAYLALHQRGFAPPNGHPLDLWSLTPLFSTLPIYSISVIDLIETNWRYSFCGTFPNDETMLSQKFARASLTLAPFSSSVPVRNSLLLNIQCILRVFGLSSPN